MKKSILVLMVLVIGTMPLLALAAEEGGGHGEEEAKSYLGIPASVFKFLNLIAFFGFLGYLLKGPILGAFKARGEQIRTELAEAAERNLKADRLATDIRARLDQIEKDVASIIARAKEDGERQKVEIIEGAKAEAEKILSTARGEVEARVKLARKELTDFAGELAADRAQTLIASSMTDADRRKTFSDSVESLVETKS